MSTIFDALANALAPFVGGVGAAGFLLGTITIIALLVGFVIMFGKDILNKQSGFVLLIFAIALVSIPSNIGGPGWYPIWVPFVLVLSLAFMYWQKYL